MNEKIIYERNKCPYCGSENIEYGSLELVDEQMYYRMTCKDCKKDSREWYSLSYIETVGAHIKEEK